MARIALTTSFLALAVTALAVPAPRAGVVTVPLTKRPAKDAQSTVAKDFARLAGFNNLAASSGAVTNLDDTYVAPVKVGSQTFQLIVDTGSSNTWVGASTQFSAGSTGKSTGNGVSVSYGSGEFSGTEYTDTVSFGGLTVDNQSIGVASSSSGFDGVDGIIGFGPVGLTEGTVDNTNTVPTFMDNLFNQGSISTEVLGVSFAPESGSDDDDTNGELTLGGTDSSKFTGSITYTPTLTSGDASAYWGISVFSITYGSSTLATNQQAIVDTGTTLIYIPASAYAEFLSITGCASDPLNGLSLCIMAPTSNFSLTVGGTTFTLTPSQYLVPKAQYSTLGLSGPASYAWINDGGSSGVDFIIGQKFLENYYAVFDTTNARVGFATRA